MKYYERSTIDFKMGRPGKLIDTESKEYMLYRSSKKRRKFRLFGFIKKLFK